MNRMMASVSQHHDDDIWDTLGEQTEQARNIAIQIIADTTHQSHDAVRVFLESRYGDHFADNVFNQLQTSVTLKSAIQHTVRHWMTGQVDPLTRKHYRISEDTPRLTAYVILCNRVTD